MAIGKGFASKLAVKKSTTWGTAVTLTTGDQVEFISESLTPDAQFISDEGLSGSKGRLAGDKGNEFHSGDLVCDVRYEGLGVLFAAALGDDEAQDQEGSDDAYRHNLQPADDMSGIHVTVGIDKGVAVWEYPTCKVNGFSFSCANGERARATFPLIPQSLAIGTGTNTSSSGWSLPANRDFLKFAQMAVRINAQSGSALDPTDLIYISSFEVAVNHNFPTDDVTTQFGNLIDEPVGDGFLDVTGSLNFSKYHDGTGGPAESSADLVAALLDKSVWKMDVVFTGPVADGSATFGFEFYFPSVQFSDGDANIGGPRRIPTNLNFSASRVLTAPTGFDATHTRAVNLQIVNQVSTDFLA